MLKTVLDWLRCQHCDEPPARVERVQSDPFCARLWRVKLWPLYRKWPAV